MSTRANKSARVAPSQAPPRRLRTTRGSVSDYYHRLAQATGQIFWRFSIHDEGDSDYALWCAFTGQSPGEATIHWLDAVHPADRAEVALKWESMLTGGTLFEGETRLRRADGVYRTFLVRTMPVLKADKQSPQQWFGTCIDITDQKRAATLAEGQAHILDLIARGEELRVIFLALGELIDRYFGDRPCAITVLDDAGAQICSSGTPFDGSVERIPFHGAQNEPLGTLVVTLMGAAPLTDADHQLFAMATHVASVAIERANLIARESIQMSRISAVFDAMTDAMFVYDAKGAVTQMNAAARHIYALDADPTYLKMSPDERAARLRMRDAHDQPLDAERWGLGPMLRGTSFSGVHTNEIVLNALDGREAHMSITGGPVHDRDGNIIGAVSIGRDVTEGYYARREAEASSRQFELIFNAIADGVVISDPEGRPLRYNPAAIEILGWDDIEALLRLNVAQIEGMFDIHLLDGSPASQARWDLDPRVAGPVELSLRRPDGSRIIVALRRSPLVDPTTGVITGGVIVFQDVTERRRLDRMKDDFIDMASHELRAPLQPLLLAAQLIERRVGVIDPSGDLAHKMNEIVANVKRLGRQIDVMLDMTHINNGNLVVQRRWCDIAAIVREVVATHREVWGIPITLTGAESAFPIDADADRLWQVFANLIANSMKHALTDKPVEVALTSVVDDHHRSMARITVRDHGIGIPPQHLSHLFDRFYRVGVVDPQSVPRRSEGLGLGLYISRAIVTEHGGCITVSSKLGVGTTFTVDIPAGRDDAR